MPHTRLRLLPDKTWDAEKLAVMSKQLADHMQDRLSRDDLSDTTTLLEWVLEEYVYEQQGLTNRINQYRGALEILRRD